MSLSWTQAREGGLTALPDGEDAIQARKDAKDALKLVGIHTFLLGKKNKIIFPFFYFLFLRLHPASNQSFLVFLGHVAHGDHHFVHNEAPD